MLLLRCGGSNASEHHGIHFDFWIRARFCAMTKTTNITFCEPTRTTEQTEFSNSAASESGQADVDVSGDIRRTKTQTTLIAVNSDSLTQSLQHKDVQEDDWGEETQESEDDIDGDGRRGGDSDD